MMPHPAVTVADLIHSLSCLPPDARVALVEVQQEWGFDSPMGVTTLVMKVFDGGFVAPQGKRIEAKKKALPAERVRIA